MAARKPYQAREPYCRHPGGEHQPASACIECSQSEWLRDWRQGWATWLDENPDSLEAYTVKQMDASGRWVTPHSCHMPLPIPALGTYWCCPDCADGWYVTDKGWVSGAHWELASKETEEHVEHIISWVRDQGWEMQPWQVRIVRSVAYQYLGPDRKP